MSVLRPLNLKEPAFKSFVFLFFLLTQLLVIAGLVGSTSTQEETEDFNLFLPLIHKPEDPIDIIYSYIDPSTFIHFNIALDFHTSTGWEVAYMKQGGFSADWSPDGKQIVYEREDGIYIMNSDGTNSRKLDTSETQGWYYLPWWSPTGNRIVFCTGGEHPLPDRIYVINNDGSDLKLVYERASSSGCPYPLAWSPDGIHIAFHDVVHGGYKIVVVNVDTSVVKIISDGDEDKWPQWSPDGSKLCYDSYRDGKGQIYISTLDGSQSYPVTNFPDDILSTCSWSPDGKRIAFSYYDISKSDADIYVVGLDGSNLINITNSPSTNEYEPIWSPHGSKIAFKISYRPQSDIVDQYVMESDGSSRVKLPIPENYGGTYKWNPVSPY